MAEQGIVMDYLAAVGSAPVGAGAHVAALARARPCLPALWAIGPGSWPALLWYLSSASGCLLGSLHPVRVLALDLVVL